MESEKLKTFEEIRQEMEGINVSETEVTGPPTEFSTQEEINSENDPTLVVLNYDSSTKKEEEEDKFAALDRLIKEKKEEADMLRKKAEESELTSEENISVINSRVSTNIVYLDNASENKTENKDEEETIKKEPKRKVPDTIKVKRKIDSEKDYNVIVEKKKLVEATTQVVLPQSLYSAQIAGLSSLEINSLNTDNTDMYVRLRKIYHLIYSKIMDTSIGKISFDDFLKMTSAREEEILFYAAYCSTYQEISEFPWRCKNCNHQFTYKVPNNDLLQIPEENKEKIINGISEILALKYTSVKEVIENSDISNIDRIILDDSGIIFDIKVPSLYDQLENIIKNITQKMYEEQEEAVELSNYIDKVFVPDPEDEESYNEVILYSAIVDVIYKLSDADMAQLSNAIAEKVLKYPLSFGVRDAVCPACGFKDTEGFTLGMRDILFMKHQLRLNELK